MSGSAGSSGFLCNVAIGNASMSNVTGSNIGCNVYVGADTAAFGTGSNNVAVGFCSQRSNCGSGNTSVGTASLAINTGNNNVAVGLNAGCALSSTAACNILIGAGAGCLPSVGALTGCGNVIIGINKGLPTPTGDNQLVLGGWLTGCSTLAIKPAAGIMDSGNSTGTAGQVLTSNGSNALVWGAPAAATPTVAGIVRGFLDVLNCNTGLGSNALLSIGFTGGTVNTAVGTNALCSLTSGNGNTAVGVNALCSNAVSNSNSAFGWGSMRSNTNGTNNTAIGINSMLFSTSGGDNLAAGAGALVNNSSGGRNTAAGYCALSANTTGSGNVMVGGMNSAGTYAPVFNPTTENNRVMIGSTATTNAYVQVAWTVVSDARDKTNVTALPVGLNFVNQLNPVSFQFKESRECDTATGPIRYGFLAQEVLAVEGEKPVIVDTEVPESLKITNDHFNAVLVKAIQELSAKVEALEAKLEANG